MERTPRHDHSCTKLTLSEGYKLRNLHSNRSYSAVPEHNENPYDTEIQIASELLWGGNKLMAKGNAAEIHKLRSSHDTFLKITGWALFILAVGIALSLIIVSCGFYVSTTTVAKGASSGISSTGFWFGIAAGVTCAIKYLPWLFSII